MAKSQTNSNTGDAGPDYLIKDKSQFDRELTEQIEKGNELVSRTVIGNGQLGRLMQDYDFWDAYNTELISRAFNRPDSKYWKEYTFSPMEPLRIGRARPTLEEVIQKAFGKVFDRIDRLKKIQQRLGLIEESAKQNAFFLKSDASNPLADLHPKVQETAGRLFKNGHFRQAILDTYIALVEEVRKRSGEASDGTPLMQKVFSRDAPILSVSSQADERLGFMWLFSGAIMGIRNPNAHRVVEHKNPQEALEWLSFASALFRTLDESHKITSP